MFNSVNGTQSALYCVRKRIAYLCFQFQYCSCQTSMDQSTVWPCLCQIVAGNVMHLICSMGYGEHGQRKWVLELCADPLNEERISPSTVPTSHICASGTETQASPCNKTRQNGRIRKYHEQVRQIPMNMNNK